MSDYRGKYPHGPHGGEGDPRYPSPRELRKFLAACVDVAVHVLPPFALLFAATHGHHTPKQFITLFAAALGTFVVVTFVHMTVIQGIAHATLGKALFGLVVIRRSDGSWPTFGNLARRWIGGVFEKLWDWFTDWVFDENTNHDFWYLTVVRRRDVLALRAAQAANYYAAQPYPQEQPYAAQPYPPAAPFPPGQSNPVPTPGYPRQGQSYPPQNHGPGQYRR
ncbi:MULTISPECIES: RDD family protein [unclassified Nocardia]|uniref:RDD family protein n=1 Tax=unclassified Nocardia TaxID=2637762 RepID=UPI001CE3EFB8|nr:MULTISPECIES: RDD family protein [unclassified Nocardia]